MRCYPSHDDKDWIAANWFPVDLGLKYIKMMVTIDPCAEDDQSVVVSMTMVIPPEIEEWLEKNLQGSWCVLDRTAKASSSCIWCETQEDAVLVIMAYG